MSVQMGMGNSISMPMLVRRLSVKRGSSIILWRLLLRSWNWGNKFHREGMGLSIKPCGEKQRLQ